MQTWRRIRDSRAASIRSCSMPSRSPARPRRRPASCCSTASISSPRRSTRGVPIDVRADRRVRTSRRVGARARAVGRRATFIRCTDGRARGGQPRAHAERHRRDRRLGARHRSTDVFAPSPRARRRPRRRAGSRQRRQRHSQRRRARRDRRPRARRHAPIPAGGRRCAARWAARSACPSRAASLDGRVAAARARAASRVAAATAARRHGARRRSISREPIARAARQRRRGPAGDDRRRAPTCAITIPMRPGVNSLNVGVDGGAHPVRGRRQRGSRDRTVAR